MPRSSVYLVLLMGALSSCGIPPANLSSEPPRNDPAVTGRRELLSQSELHVLLIVARKKLATLAPAWPIRRVNVITSAKVEAWYRWEGSEVHYLLMERVHGEWRVTRVSTKWFDEDTEGPDNLIIIGSNQALELTAARTAFTLSDD